LRSAGEIISEAIADFRAAAPYELGHEASSIYGWTALYPVFVRSEAHLAAHQGNEAAAEFQKILDRRGIVLNSPVAAHAHLGFARAHVVWSRNSNGLKRRGFQLGFTSCHCPSPRRR